MNYNFGIKGQVEAVVIAPDGTIKQREIKKNTITHAALSSMFCDFLFGGIAAATRERSYPTGTSVPVLDFVRARLLGGIDTTDKQVPIYSYRQPETLIGYILDIPAKIKSTTQVPPYVDATLINVSPHVRYFFLGRMIDDDKDLTTAIWANVDDQQKMQYDFIRTGFDPQTITYSVRFYATAGTSVIRSFVIGSGYNDPSVFETRTRPSGCPFGEAGRSQFWAIEHRPKWETIIQPDLSETKRLINSETILWQDITTRWTSTATTAAHAIPGYNITAGKIEYTPKTDVTLQTYMGDWMQGVIIGDNAYSAVKEGNNQITITKHLNWNTAIGQTPAKESSTITLPYRKSYTYSTNPILVHNLETGHLEIILTIAHDQHVFDVARAIVDTTTLEPLAVYNYESPVALGNIEVSRKGDTATLNATQGTSALTSTGFLDWRTGIYYLPQSGEMRDNAAVAVGAIRSGSWSRVGCMVKLDEENKQLEIVDRYLICYPISGDGSASTNNDNAQTIDGQLENKFLEWGYFAEGVVQFMPFTGVKQNSSDKIHPFTFVNPSRVMCGLDFDADIIKAPEDVLRITYSWCPTVENPLSPLLAVDDIPVVQSATIVVHVYNPTSAALYNIKGVLSLTTDPEGDPKFVYPTDSMLNDPNTPYKITLNYPQAMFQIPSLPPYQKATLSFNVAFFGQVTYAGQVTLNPIPNLSTKPVLFGGTTVSLS
jgi:hypothetical protein